LPTDPLIDLTRERQLLADDEKAQRQRLARQEFNDTIRSAAEDVLTAARLRGTVDSDATKLALNGVLRAHIENVRILRAMLEGDYPATAPRDPMFAGMAPTGLPPLPGEPAEYDPHALTLSTATERYCHQHAGKTWVPKTAADQLRVCSIAVGIIGGEKLVRALDTADVISLRDALQRLPSNYTKLAAT
ncbi:hypothetical protein VQ045_21900, partial [Aurantimonas sp. E1-2-R+4]